jgi:mRNA interferase MazF
LVPRRGEIYWADLDPVVGHELGRKIRPVVIVSSDEMNSSPAEKVIIVPTTTQPHNVPSRVAWDVRTPAGIRRSYFCCDDVRSISVERTRGRIGLGTIPGAIMTEIEKILRSLLAL